MRLGDVGREPKGWPAWQVKMLSRLNPDGVVLRQVRDGWELKARLA